MSPKAGFMIGRRSEKPQLFTVDAVARRVSEPKLLSTPAAALFCGVVIVVLWVAGLEYLYDLASASVVQLLTTGAMGAVGAALGTLVLSWAARGARDKLDEVEHRAKHDPLTGLTNRAELFRELDESLMYASDNDMVLGVLFLDLDRFKSVNDSLGHEVGDELLCIVADRLRSTVRNTDVVARLGGDEFVVLCRGLLLGDSVIAMAKQILKRFREPISLNGKEHLVSTSIGVAIAPPGDDRLSDELVSDADAAMYQAKRTKSGFAVFDEAQRQLVRDRLDVERALNKAIEEGELAVYYQPIIDATTRRLYGFEALVRWHNPEQGLIPPGEFLAIAEEAGMMSKLGELVMREACAQLAVWNHEYPNARQVRIGVNLAEQQLIDNRLPATVSEILDWSGLDPHQLVLEITEDVIVDHLDGLNVLRGLRELGVALAIDDFGTGQSSLSYVKQFDMVSTIKIDQAFVREMHSANVDRAIIEAVVAMASALDLKIVAEGVEYPEQLDELLRLGVHLVQGYLFSPPIPAHELDPAVWFLGPDGRLPRVHIVPPPDWRRRGSPVSRLAQLAEERRLLSEVDGDSHRPPGRRLPPADRRRSQPDRPRPPVDPTPDHTVGAPAGLPPAFNLTSTPPMPPTAPSPLRPGSIPPLPPSPPPPRAETPAQDPSADGTPSEEQVGENQR
jgi:diguanylate cyclase (GGDEF)-like protein